MSKRYVPRERKPDTMKLPSMATGKKKRWTIEDRQYLLTNSKTMYVEDLAKYFGRTVKAVKDKAFLMGCSIKSKGNTNE